jgi:DeoR family transcriptional regulator, suf operon transcriptional repressor
VKFGTDNSKLSTREIILDSIKRSHEATVDALAEIADVSPVTVRHHLNSLQAEGLLESRSVRRKVGRPYYVYRLSDQGQELFPKRYMRLSSLLLDELKSRFATDVVTELFNSVVEKLVDEHRPEINKLDFEERLDFLIEILEQEGFLADWELTETGYRLTEYSCPYISVGQKHSEICSFDKTLITIVLEADITQHTCMLRGDTCCEFSVAGPGRDGQSQIAP